MRTKRVTSTPFSCWFIRFSTTSCIFCELLEKSINIAMKSLKCLYFIIGLSNLCFSTYAYHKNRDEYFAANLLREVVDRMNNEFSDGYADIDRSNLAIKTRLSPTVIKEEDDEPNYTDIIDEVNAMPSLRDNEYLQHSSLWGHQFVTGGAGEGKQNLTPEGTVSNKNEVKTDAVLPAYCNPPNPCPVGFSAEDGCIQRFENTASFSREYQASQKCMCDTEHMFDCPSPREFSYDNDLGFEPMVRRFKVNREKEMNVKKMFPDKTLNPFLQGEMLPIAAKKGISVGF